MTLVPFFIAQAAVPQVSLVTSFTGVTLPPQVTVIPVRYKVDNGPERTQTVPLACTGTLCSGSVVVVDPVNGTGSKGFTVPRSTDLLAPFPLALFQDHHLVAAGNNHGLVLRNGEVWSFGSNVHGQLGLGYKDETFHPRLRKIQGLSHVASVYAGKEFSVALDSSGDVWTWGSNQYGKLGNGKPDPNGNFGGAYLEPAYSSYFSVPIPSKILSGRKVVSLSAGNDQAFAVDTLGRVWAWGWDYGIMRVPQNIQGVEAVPFVLTWFSGARAVSMNSEYSNVAVLGWDGTVKIWGNTSRNWKEIFGSPDISVPFVYSPDLSGFGPLVGPIAVQYSADHYMAEYVRSDNGTHVVMGTGNESSGLFWSGPRRTSLGYAGIGSLEELSDHGDTRVSYGAITGGIANWCGFYGSVFNNNYSWVPFVGSNGMAMIANDAEVNSKLGLVREVATGKIQVWGLGSSVDGSGANVFRLPQWLDWDSSSLVPATITLQSSFAGITLPPSVSQIPVAYKVDGGATINAVLPLTCSGTLCTAEIRYNDYRGLAKKIFSVTRSTDPLAPFPLGLFQDHHLVAAGNNHGLVLRNGEVWSFGSNVHGQLGLGYKDGAFHTRLRKIEGLSHVASVYAGKEFSVALDSSGDVWTWGSNQYGKLGNGKIDPNGNFGGAYSAPAYNSYFSVPIPTKVLSGRKVVSMSAGNDQTFAVDTLGRVWAWGWDCGIMRVPQNNQGVEAIPFVLGWFSGARSVSMNSEYGNVAILGWDGTVKIWGNPSHNWKEIFGAPDIGEPFVYSPNLSGFGPLVGPIAVQYSANHYMAEYVRSDDGTHVLMGTGNESSGLFWSGLRRATLGYAGLGTLGELSDHGDTRVSYGPITGGIASWCGFYGSVFNNNYSWVPFVGTDGNSMIANDADVNSNLGLVREASTGKIQVWGLGSAVDGTGSNVFKYPQWMNPDDTSSSNLSLDSFAIDSIVVSANLSSLTTTYKLGSLIGTLTVPLVCTDSFNCLATFVVQTPDGQLRGKQVNVVRRKLSYGDVVFQSPGIGGVDVKTFAVSSQIQGNWFARIWRLDQGKVEDYGLVPFGKKASDTLKFNWQKTGGFGWLHDGTYALQYIVSSYGQRDSVNCPFMSGVAPFFDLYSYTNSANGYRWKFSGDTRRIANISISMAPGIPSDSLLATGVWADSAVPAIHVSSILRKDGSKSIESGYLFARTWDTLGCFKISAQGPVNQIQIAATSHSPSKSRVIEVRWDASGSDSVQLVIDPATNTAPRYKGASVGQTILALPKGRNSQTHILGISAWRGGRDTRKYLLISEEALSN